MVYTIIHSEFGYLSLVLSLFVLQILSDFINLTQVHNFTVSAQDIFYLPSTFGIYRKLYENFASSNADNETFCTVLLSSQVVLVQSLQPKGPEFEST